MICNHAMMQASVHDVSFSKDIQCAANILQDPDVDFLNGIAAKIRISPVPAGRNDVPTLTR